MVLSSRSNRVRSSCGEVASGTAGFLKSLTVVPLGELGRYGTGDESAIIHHYSLKLAEMSEKTASPLS